MKKLCLLYLVLMASVPALAGETKEVKEQVRQPEKPKMHTEQLPQKQRQAPVSNTFQPTEKIKADTVISFPADI